MKAERVSGFLRGKAPLEREFGISGKQGKIARVIRTEEVRQGKKKIGTPYKEKGLWQISFKEGKTHMKRGRSGGQVETSLNEKPCRSPSGRTRK